MTERKDLEAYPETNLSNQLLLHHQEMLQFLFFTNYDIIYETFELKHASYSERNRGRIAQTFKTEEIARHFQMMSEKNHIRVLRDDIDLDKQLSKLEVLWHNRNIPYFHRYYFLKFLLSCYLKNILPAISREEELIKSEQHIYFTLFRSINAREACLRNLKRLLAELGPQDVHEYLHTGKERLFNERRKNERQKYKAQGYKLKLVEETFEGKMSKTKLQFFSDSFNHLSKLTLYVIELISKWKEYIGSITHDGRKQKERMEYYFYDDNYFLKILSDLGFLKVSFLGQFYDFAPKNDPFLLQCVLGFEKKKEKTVEQELLKMIFIPQKEHLADIMAKLELLSEEYRHNIRSRKVFDPKTLKQPISRVQEKIANNEIREDLSNSVLKKIHSPLIPQKSKSVSTFRVRQKNGPAVDRDKIVVEFRGSPKKVPSIPGVVEKSIFDREKDNPLKNSVLLQKNENSMKLGGVDWGLLATLKQEVVRKVREQFQLHKGTTPHESQALQLFIDTKVKETIKGIFPFEPEKNIKAPIEFSPLFISDLDLPAEIEAMFKDVLPEYREMQVSQPDLLKLLEQAEYIYVLVGKIQDQEVGRVICSLEKDVQEFKVLKIVYLHFLDLSQMEVLILKFVEFLWEYQNSFQIHFNFLQPAGSQAIQLQIESLEKTLEKECMFAQKQLYSTVKEVKLIFKRPNKNVNYIPNRYPFSLHLEFSLLSANKKVMLESRNQQKNLEVLHYDYFLMQIIRRILSSQQILTLKETVSWKTRLKLIVEMIKHQEETDLMVHQLKQLDATNISELNTLLTKIQHPFLELSDLVKNNAVTLLTTAFTLTPAFPVKAINRGPNDTYYRFSIMKKFPVSIDSSGTEFFLLPTQENDDYYLLVFSAKEFVNQLKTEGRFLSEYLAERVSERGQGWREVEKVVKHLWIPMVRFPGKYKEREEVFYHTTRLADLAPLKLDLFIGERLQMFCSMEMRNSVQFEAHEGDCLLGFPLGLGVVSGKTRTVVYSRVFH